MLPSSLKLSCAPSLVFAGVLFVGLGCSISGCVSTIALDRAVVAYDQTAIELVSKQLPLNIARARHNQPMHFTVISSIAAIYNFGFSAGATSALTGEHGSLIAPIFGATAVENPTISIAPRQGEEFTQRLLMPFHEQKLTMLLRQSYDVDALLRLLGGEVRLANDEGLYTSVSNNRPSDHDGYTRFRRVVSHLSSIRDRHDLHVEPLLLEYNWTIPASAMTVEGFQSIFKDFFLTYDPEKQRQRHKRDQRLPLRSRQVLNQWWQVIVISFSCFFMLLGRAVFSDSRSDFTSATLQKRESVFIRLDSPL